MNEKTGHFLEIYGERRYEKMDTIIKTERHMKHLNEINWAEKLSAQVIITPEQAQQVLDNHNEGNRYMRANGAKYIARQIILGEWIEDHPQPICFSDEGQLLDGQHRLAGIVMGGQPVIANVMFGVPQEYMKYLDTGISRHLFDRVRFSENNSVNRFISGMISSLRHIGTASPTYCEATRYNKVTPEEALSVFHSRKKSFLAVAGLNRKKKSVGAATVGMAFVDYHHAYGGEALDFYDEIFNATTDNKNAQILRNWIQTTDKPQKQIYPYVVSACLANHDNRTLKVVRAASWR